MIIFLLPILCFLLALAHPRSAVLGLVVAWPLYLWRGTVLGIPTTSLELSIYAVMLGWCVAVFFQRARLGRTTIPRSIMIMVGVWLLGWLTSAFFSADRAAALGALKAWAVDPMLFAVLLSQVIRTTSDRLQLMKAAVVSGLVVALAGLGQMMFFRATLQDGRLSSFFHPVANYAAMYLGPLFMLTLGLTLLNLVSRRWWIATAIIGIGLALTVSYGGFLAAAAGSIVLWLALPAGWVKTWTWRAAVVAAILVIALLSTTRNFREHFGEGRSSALVRTQIWVTSWAIIRQHPLWGIGPNTFEIAYRNELPHHYFPPLEWLVAQPHNLYLALWLETGLLGLLAFAGLVVAQVRAVIGTIRRDPTRRLVDYIALAALMGLLVHGLVDTPYFKNDLALEFFFFLLLPWIGNALPTTTENKNTA